ncbi:putative argininosuccinate lyase [Lachnellula subtilissima]|uniref:argininosuccinate lyase n=1 Tax=Lachnellula subtilissima TaxID=602034 RepID=A0A8H8UHG0_9HELO|nr:putative argininosuccinate lyase [Lachnellula subtilissima]
MASEQLRAPGSKPGENMLWGGRFTGGLDPLMVSYNESIYYDRAFHTQDILGSIAWARANYKTGILTASEFSAIESGLKKVEEEWVAGTFKIIPGVDEDIHTANERRLGEIIGKEVGGKLHTGRSRNEQVATDMRLWLRDELRKIEVFLVDFLKVTAARAEQEIDLIMPGYTHLQRAQPIRWSHWMLSYGMAFASDLERLREVVARVNLSPLGAGALAGNCFGVDREAMAKELGFEGLLWNSMAAVSSRDFVLETMQWGTMLMTHLSRWSEDLIIYGTGEFSFVRLADAYSTGSSLMPQKKNSDSLELLRGKTGRAFGQMAGLTMTIKGLPSTYNKDLQESVEPMLDHVKTVSDSIRIATGVLSTLAVNPEKMRASLDPFMLATDLADYLVRKGVPFRETHHISGQCVAFSEKSKIPMDQMKLTDFQAIDSRFGQDILDCFSYETSVEFHSAAGGTAKKSVEDQIKVMKSILE